MRIIAHNSKLPLVIWLLLLLCVDTVAGKDTRPVSATYQYILSSSENEKEGRVRALEAARAKALADAFGTYLSFTEHAVTRHDRTREVEAYNSFSTSNIGGIWVKTINESTEMALVDGSIVITASVSGLGCPRDIANPEFEYELGRIDDRGNFIPTSDFKNRERFDISFVSPVSGYLAIYASDGVNEACRILPEAASPISEPIFVEARKACRFFEDASPVMALGPDEDSALLRFTFIFLPGNDSKPFALPLDAARVSTQGDVMGWNVSNSSYQKWLDKMMSNPKLQRRDIIISIVK